MDIHDTANREEKILHVRLPLSTYRRLRHEAVERGMTNTQLVVEFIDGRPNVNPNQAQAKP